MDLREVPVQGLLNIGFAHLVQNPLIAGIQIFDATDLGELPGALTFAPGPWGRPGPCIPSGRINCGGPAVVDDAGWVWAADTQFLVAGDSVAASAALAVSGVGRLRTVFATRRNFPALNASLIAYSIPVPATVTSVTARLYFAASDAIEAYAARMFSVFVNNFAVPAINSLDVAQLVGTGIGTVSPAASAWVADRARSLLRGRVDDGALREHQLPGASRRCAHHGHRDLRHESHKRALRGTLHGAERSALEHAERATQRATQRGAHRTAQRAANFLAF